MAGTTHIVENAAAAMRRLHLHHSIHPPLNGECSPSRNKCFQNAARLSRYLDDGADLAGYRTRGLRNTRARLPPTTVSWRANSLYMEHHSNLYYAGQFIE